MEEKSRLNRYKDIALKNLDYHKCVHFGLTSVYALAGVIGDKPQIYWPVAALYAVLTIRG